MMAQADKKKKNARKVFFGPKKRCYQCQARFNITNKTRYIQRKLLLKLSPGIMEEEQGPL